MKPSVWCWMLIPFSLLIFSGTANAHPHELGKINHGPSLESYQIGLDFTTDLSTKNWYDPNITIAEKDKARKDSKIDRVVRHEKVEKNKRFQKNKKINKVR